MRIAFACASCTVLASLHTQILKHNVYGFNMTFTWVEATQHLPGKPLQAASRREMGVYIDSCMWRTLSQAPGEARRRQERPDDDDYDYDYDCDYQYDYKYD